MSASRIEWCDHSINVVDGCSPASPGCDHCYAARMKGTRHAHMACALPDGQTGKNADLVTIGKMRDGGRRYVYNGKVALNAVKLERALRIPRNGGKAGPRVFFNFQSDTFHESLQWPDIDAQFTAMDARPDLRFLVLTKRPARAYEYFRWRADQRHAHIAVGVSAEDQKRWDERVPVLLDMKARGMIARAFVSAEPLLGPIDPRGAIEATYIGRSKAALQAARYPYAKGAGLDQVIIGAESGPGARSCNPAWIRDLGGYTLDAQRRGGTGGPALFIKQADICSTCAGEYTHDGCTGAAGKVRKGCPEFWIPGHGRGPWAQHMEGF